MPEQAATGNIATEVNCLPLWQDVVSDCHCHGVCTCPSQRWSSLLKIDDIITHGKHV